MKTFKTSTSHSIHFYQAYKNKNEVLKKGKEYRNPFTNINKKNINIGLFGSENTNKTELSFRYIYGDLYKTLYDDFIENFTDNSLVKIVEFKNQYFNVSILDSTFVKENDDDFCSCYSAVQCIVFVFQIDLLSSSSDFIKDINKFFKNTKDSVGSEMKSIIALKVSESDQIDDLYESLSYDKIKQIETKFETKVYLFLN